MRLSVQERCKAVLSGDAKTVGEIQSGGGTREDRTVEVQSFSSGVGESVRVSEYGVALGHYNYFGLRSNEKALKSFYRFAIGCAFNWLNRRGGGSESWLGPIQVSADSFSIHRV